MTTTEQRVTVMTETDDTVVDMKLFKTIGLYWFLRPAEHGGIGERTRRACFTIMWFYTVYIAVQFAWQLVILPDIKQTMHTNATLMFHFLSLSKAYAILRHRSQLWNLLDSGRSAFTTCGLRQLDTVRRCRDTVFPVLRIYVTVCFFTAIIWVLSPLFLTEYIPVTHVDGTVGHYRVTVLNTWFPLPEHIHNSLPGWTAMYLVEAVTNIHNAFYTTILDCYVITMCFVLNSQFHTVSTSYETLGHRLSKSLITDFLDGFLDMPSESVKMVHYNDLICHIHDTQKIIINHYILLKIKHMDPEKWGLNNYVILLQKNNEFVDVLRPFIIAHVLNCSFSLIGYTFLFCVAFLTELSTINVDSLRILSTLIIEMAFVFLYCYGCDSIETAKSSLNFGLYSCNWTEMDLKFQKTLLLAMSMNSSHKKAMQITPIYKINLELFFKVIKTSFSVVPVLLQLNSQNER